jgi:hypothetical protein
MSQIIKILMIAVIALIYAPTAAIWACAEPARNYSTYPLHKWHAAQTDAEQKLDLILRLIDDTEQGTNIFHYIETWPHTKPDAPLQHADFFTKDLVYAWSRLEKETADQECNGRYLDGEICGLNFNPLTGEQDVPEAYFYHTAESGPDYAIVQTLWDSDLVDLIKTPLPLATFSTLAYRMVLHNGVWLIDGVTTFSLNFPN